jgi:hypothetical protein
MNTKKLLRKILPGQFLRPESISDDGAYPAFCMKAGKKESVFSNFRRHKAYTRILEHVSEELGTAYLNEINKNDSELLNSVEKFKENDKWGNPILVKYPVIGEISPSTLRYIKVLGDLMSLFKNLDDFKICEIGVGYGGQCRIINSINSPAEYTLVDINPALMLSKRYLDHYVLNAVLHYKIMDELPDQQYDLVISNYAFSELPRSIQEVYLKKVVLNSKKGYITFNEIAPDYFNSYKKEELLSLIPNAHVIEEVPLTSPKNCIIVWGDKS